MPNKKAMQADFSFRDGLASIIDESGVGKGEVPPQYSLQRWNYVLIAKGAMDWWIDSGFAGRDFKGPPGIPQRDRIILAHAGLMGHDMGAVRRAIEAQTEHMNRST